MTGHALYTCACTYIHIRVAVHPTPTKLQIYSNGAPESDPDLLYPRLILGPHHSHPQLSCPKVAQSSRGT
eukprot:7081036-Pyramimonas_sp.AAC.1